MDFKRSFPVRVNEHGGFREGFLKLFDGTKLVLVKGASESPFAEQRSQRCCYLCKPWYEFPQEVGCSQETPELFERVRYGHCSDGRDLGRVGFHSGTVDHVTQPCQGGGANLCLASLNLDVEVSEPLKSLAQVNVYMRVHIRAVTDDVVREGSDRFIHQPVEHPGREGNKVLLGAS